MGVPRITLLGALAERDLRGQALSRLASGRALGFNATRPSPNPVLPTEAVLAWGEKNCSGLVTGELGQLAEALGMKAAQKVPTAGQNPRVWEDRVQQHRH